MFEGGVLPTYLTIQWIRDGSYAVGPERLEHKERKMNSLLRLQFTIFALIGIGIFLRKIDMVGKEGQKNITDLVINVVLPCNIVMSFVQDIDKSALYDCIYVFLISVGIQILCLVYARTAYKNMDEARKKCLIYGILVSNAGFLGNPVAQGLYGDMGLMLASVYLTPLRIMMWSEGVALFSGSKDTKETAVKVATHPCVIACVLGIIILVTKVFTGVTILPSFLTSLLDTIGKCNTGLSMLVIGMIVSDVKPSDFLDRLVFRYSMERLVLIPGVIALLLLPLVKMGLISSLVLGLCVILAAMPAATTTSMMSAKYNCVPEFGAKMVVVSTVLSIPSIFVWSLLLSL